MTIDYNNEEEISYESNIYNSDGEKLVNETEKKVQVTKLHYVLLVLFTLSCYVGCIGGSQIMTQYIYFRYSEEVGLSGGGNNTGSTSNCLANNSDPDFDKQTEVQRRSAKLSFYNNLFMLPKVFTIMIMGGLSDRMGRKLSIMIPWLATALQTSICGAWIAWDLPMWVYLVSQIPSSLTGGYIVMISAMFASLADITTEKKRGVALAIGESGLMLSVLISSAIVGWLIKLLSYKIPYYIMLGLTLISGIFACFLTETSPVKLKKKIIKINDDEDIEPIKGNVEKKNILLQFYQVFTVNKHRTILLILLLAVSFVYLWVFMGNMGITTYYLFNQPFCWNSVYLGYYQSFNVGFSSFGSVLLISFTRRRLKEYWIVAIGIVSMISSNVLMGLASTFPNPFDNYTIIASVIACAFAGAVMPISRSMISKTVTKYEIGAIFGALGSLESLGSTVGGLVNSSIYQATVATFSGTFAFFNSIMGCLCMGFMVVYIIFTRRSPSPNS